MNSTVKTVVFWLVILLSAIVLWQVVKMGGGGQKEKEINFSQFMTDVDQGNIKEVTVTGENSLTGIATADGGGKTISFTVKVEGNKITLNVSVGENAATLTATKKATEGKDAATVEGTYEGQFAPEGQKTFSVELIIKRIKPADK